ncbi:hypothetical protein EWH70_09450 [Amycolatopsis suaedae]|uniref:Uncharacterized protein n=2 Tax=Amycolatopsis suaedae TaxID=2510978 RepID=A0A4Q7JCE2_9PSEU|nr:hypothetical protein EWH70_09450 [Amycolatopsis suaedae]
MSMVAALDRAEAHDGLPELLPTALREVGLPSCDRGSIAAEETALRIVAAAALTGEVTPRDLTTWVHQRHGHFLKLAEELARLDDAYEYTEFTAQTREEIDADVLAEARRIIGSGPGGCTG